MSNMKLRQGIFPSPFITQIAAILFAVSICLIHSSAEGVAKGPVSVKKKAGTTKYEMLLPADFDKKDRKTKYSLIFVMHGAEGQIEWMSDYWYTSGATEEGYIIVCPHLKYKHVLYSKIFAQIGRILASVKKNYPIDSDNLYVTGFSAGAETAIYYAIKKAKVFKAVAVVGGRIRKDILDNSYYDKKNIKKLKVYILHGEKDHRQWYKTMTNTLKKYGADVKAELMEGGHEYEIDQVMRTLGYFNDIRGKK